MNPHFSFKRINLLAIRYFTEHGRRDLVTLCALFVAFVFLPRLQFNPFLLFCFVLFIGGMRFTARIFHEIHQPGSGMHYLHIPASRLEKFILNGTITLILFPLVCLLLFWGGTLFGNLIAPIVPSFFHYPVIDTASLIPWAQIGKGISQYVLLQATFFLGSLIFKKHPTTKTFLSIFAFSLAIGIIQLILISILWTDIDTTSTGLFYTKLEQFTAPLLESRIVPYLNYLFNGVVVIFFWVVAYLKFTEKQV